MMKLGKEMKKRFRFHPKFRVELIQMLRHKEDAAAVRKVLAWLRDEIRFAVIAERESREDESGGEEGDDGEGFIEVPALERCIELDYIPRPVSATRSIKKEKEIDRDYGFGR